MIDSGIKRRIPGLRVHRIDLTAIPGKAVYVVYIRQSSLAPHMASDHRYYKRLGTTTAFMEEYEVRDVARRAEVPDLKLRIVCPQSQPNRYLRAYIRNESPEPVYHANVRLYLPGSWTVLGSTWEHEEFDELLISGKQTQFKAVRYSWGVAENPPLLEGEEYPLPPCTLNRRELPAQAAWGIRAPKMKERLVAFVMVDSEGAGEVTIREQMAVPTRPTR